MTHKTFHVIRPRYTPGITCTTYYELAMQFATQERKAFRIALEGKNGPEAKERAERMGINGIAETRIMEKSGDSIKYNVIDLVSKKEYTSTQPLPDELKYRPLFLLSIEIGNDWEDDLNDKASDCIKMLRELCFMSDKTSTGVHAAEIVMTLLINSAPWKGLISKKIKHELQTILCGNVHLIEDGMLRSAAKVLCSRSF